MNTVPLRVAVQSRQRLVRDALAGCLAGRPDFSVVGRTARYSDLLELCLLRRPDALLMEAENPDCTWIETVSAVHARHPSTAIVVVYQSLTPAEMVRAYRSGVTSLVPYSRGLDTVVAALKARPVSAASGVDARTRRNASGALTDRELEIVSLICAGQSVREVASALDISPRTVENHKRRIYDKLGVHSQSQAVAHAAQLGLIRPTLAPAPEAVPLDGAGPAPFVLVQGGVGAVREAVARALSSGGLPYTFDPAESVTAPACIVVLVDPGPEDWPATEGLRVVLIHSGPVDQSVTVDAVLRGADGIVPAERVEERLVPVLNVVTEGFVAIDSRQVRAFFHALGTRFTPSASTLPSSVLPELTAREHDILRSIAQGDTVRQTARSLGISVKTVENTQGRLFRKLGARNRAGALAVAHGLGLVEVL